MRNEPLAHQIGGWRVAGEAKKRGKDSSTVAEASLREKRRKKTGTATKILIRTEQPGASGQIGAKSFKRGDASYSLE